MKTRKIFNYVFFALSLLFMTACTDSSEPIGGRGETMDNAGGGGTGQGGSLARFTITKNRLYIVTSNTLYTYSLDNPSEPKYIHERTIWATVETIFAMGDYLFLGTQSGVEIYTIIDPDNPAYTSRYEHIVSCDPVVAQGMYAYSTLRTGTQCFRGVNRLDVINIQNIAQPFEEFSIPMENPIGLGISRDLLFVCDNSKLKAFSIKQPNRPTPLGTTINVDGCFDVIALDDRLLVVHDKGLNQYSINHDNGSLSLLSQISVE